MGLTAERALVSEMNLLAKVLYAPITDGTQNGWGAVRILTILLLKLHTLCPMESFGCRRRIQNAISCLQAQP